MFIFKCPCWHFGCYYTLPNHADNNLCQGIHTHFLQNNHVNILIYLKPNNNPLLEVTLWTRVPSVNIPMIESWNKSSKPRLIDHVLENNIWIFKRRVMFWCNLKNVDATFNTFSQILHDVQHSLYLSYYLSTFTRLCFDSLVVTLLHAFLDVFYFFFFSILFWFPSRSIDPMTQNWRE